MQEVVRLSWIPPLETYPQFDDNALCILKERYLRHNPETGKQENPDEMFWRVASFVAGKSCELRGEDIAHAEFLAVRFFDIMRNLLFLPNSPTLMNAGTNEGQLAACFVLPIEDDMSSIFTAVHDMAMISKSGGGVGYNFSELRPRGSTVGSTGGVASGPVSFMSMFDRATEVVMQGGMRRGANMGLLNCDHPDLLEFIHCKDADGSISNFNLSVAVTDAFMCDVLDNKPWTLKHPKSDLVIATSAQVLFREICEQAWKTGDPGLLFIDKINRENTTPHLGDFSACNPCGETPLLPYEACNLGSLNVARLWETLHEGDDCDELLGRIVNTAVDFLDRVIDVNEYPLPRIRDAVLRTRKIGLGIMGWADMLLARGIPYNSEQAEKLAKRLMRAVSECAWKASDNLTAEYGAFEGGLVTFYDEVANPYISVARNATVTTIAPTGSISNIAMCSGGIEPIFASRYTRLTSWGEKLEYVHPAWQKWEKEGGDASHLVTAHDISPEWHVRMQAAFQEYVDNAVSKTINLPHDATVQDVYNAFMLAWRYGCKGITVYRDGCKANQVLTVNEPASLVTRPDILDGRTIKLPTSYENLYVHLNYLGEQPIETFVTMGKSGSETKSFVEAVGRLITLCLKGGVPIEKVYGQLIGISGQQPVWHDGMTILSVPDGIGKGLKLIAESMSVQPLGRTEPASAPQTYEGDVDMCPSCGAPLVHREGCIACASCGYSKC